MTSFVPAGFRKIEQVAADCEQQLSRTGATSLGGIGGLDFPQGLASAFATYVSAWSSELTAVDTALTHLGQASGQVASAIDSLDEQAASDFTAP